MINADRKRIKLYYLTNLLLCVIVCMAERKNKGETYYEKSKKYSNHPNTVINFISCSNCLFIFFCFHSMRDFQRDFLFY